MWESRRPLRAPRASGSDLKGRGTNHTLAGAPDIRAIATAAPRPSSPAAAREAALPAPGHSAQGAPAPLLPSTPLHLTTCVLFDINTLSLDLTKLHWQGGEEKNPKKLSPTTLQPCISRGRKGSRRRQSRDLDPPISQRKTTSY